MRSATRSADMPGPGSRVGHDVTMRQRRVCARATAGMAMAAPAPATTKSFRREISDMACLQNFTSPPLMEMMHRAVTLADGEFVGSTDRVRDVGFCRAHGVDKG